MYPKTLLPQAEYEAAMARMEHLFFTKPGTPEHGEVTRLIVLVEEYEEKVSPITLHVAR